MKPKYFTLSASAIYLMGMLVGCRLDPFFDHGITGGLLDLHQTTIPKDEIVLDIAWNNVSVVLINLFGGFSLGIVSLLNTFYNGTVLGYAVSVAANNFSVIEAFEHILPHSVEVVAVILSCSLGLQIGVHLFGRIFAASDRVFDCRRFAVRVLVVFAIVWIAAVLEVYVSMTQ